MKTLRAGLVATVLATGLGVIVAPASVSATCDGVTVTGTVMNAANPYAGAKVYFLAGPNIPGAPYAGLGLGTIPEGVWGVVLTEAAKELKTKPPTPSEITAFEDSDFVATTNSSGVYSMCIKSLALNLFKKFMGGSFKLQVVAVAKVADIPLSNAPTATGTIGSSFSETTTSCTSSCTLDVAMQEPTVWGLADGPSSDAVIDINLEPYSEGGGDGGGGGPGAYATFPVSSPSGRFAAAVEGLAASTFRVVGGSLTSTVFARTVSAVAGNLAGIGPGNLQGRVLLPDGTSPPANSMTFYPTFNIMPVNPDSLAPVEPTEAYDFTAVDLGYFMGQLSDGTYQLSLGFTGFPASTVYVDVEGGVVTINNATEADAEFTAGLLTVTLDEAKIRFVVLDAGGNPTPTGPTTAPGAIDYTWNPEWNGFGCNGQCGLSISDEGVYGWNPEDGTTYRLTLIPPPEKGVQLLAPTSFYVKYVEAADGPALHSCEYDYESAPDCGDEPIPLTPNEEGYYEFQMLSATAVANVLDTDGEPIEIWTTTSHWVESGLGGYWQELFGASSNNEGVLGLNLERTLTGEGVTRYKIRTSTNQRPGVAPGQVEFCVTTLGEIDEILEPGVDVGACDGTADSVEFDVMLTAPNVVATVRVPTVGSPVAKRAPVWIEEQDGLGRYYPTDQTQTDGNGGFSLFLEPATTPYRLSIEPPQQYAAVSSRTTFYVFVGDDEVACIVDSADEDSCVGKTPGPDFALTLDEPNVRGTVLYFNPSGAAIGVRAWIQVEAWNGTWFEWTGISGETSFNGNYALSLGDGEYKITAEPRPGSGYARTSRYVKIEGTDWCEFNLIDNAPDDCVGPTKNLADDDIDIAVKGVNFRALVADPSGEPLNRVWVDVVQKSDYEWTWIAGAGTRSDGWFGVRIELPTGDGWEKVTLVINPPFGDNPDLLVPKEIDVWVGDANSDGVRDDICLEDPGDGGNCALPTAEEEETDLLLAPYAYDGITLTAGNVNGIVYFPESVEDGAAAADVQLNVEKWNEEWQWWQWVNVWARTNADGMYSLNLTEPGQYKITATPWGRVDVGRSSVVICIDADSGLDANCDDVSDPAGSTVDFVLAEPNVVGTVVFGGDGVANAWVSVEMRMAGNCGGPDSWTWWQQTGDGANTNSDGNFALVIDDTLKDPCDPTEPATLRLSVNPPWNWDGDVPLVRFSSQSADLTKPNYVPATADEFEIDPGDPPFDYTLSFPEPNFQLEVLDQSGDPVRNAWVNVEKKTSSGADSTPCTPDDVYTWTDAYGGTDRNGRVAINVEDGDWTHPDVTTGCLWRVTVNPPWGSTVTDLPRFTVMTADLTDLSTDDDKAADVVVATTSFPEPNVIGSVVASDSDLSIAWAWIEIRDPDTGSWIAGTNANQRGEFSLSLDNGTYEVFVHANGRINRPPLRLELTVTGGSVDEWSYGSGPNECPSPGTCVVDVDFDEIQPNWAIKVTDGATPLRGVLVTIDGASIDPIDLVTDEDGYAYVTLPGTGTYDIDYFWITAGSSGTVHTCEDIGIVIEVPGSGFARETHRNVKDFNLCVG